MMHPDTWAMIVAMSKAFIMVNVCIYAFKLGQAAYQAAAPYMN
jgi:hypothetical protein